MSLLLEALKKAELAKQNQAHSDPGETTLPLSSGVDLPTGDARVETPLDIPTSGDDLQFTGAPITRDQLPDLDRPLDIGSPDLGVPTDFGAIPRDGIDLRLDHTLPPTPASALAGTAIGVGAAAARRDPAEPPARNWSTPAEDDRDAARRMFEAKGLDYNPRRPFYAALGALAAVALGAVGYFWYEMQPKTNFASVPRPASTASTAPASPASAPAPAPTAATSTTEAPPASAAPVAPPAPITANAGSATPPATASATVPVTPAAPATTPTQTAGAAPTTAPSAAPASAPRGTAPAIPGAPLIAIPDVREAAPRAAARPNATIAAAPPVDTPAAARPAAPPQPRGLTPEPAAPVARAPIAVAPAASEEIAAPRPAPRAAAARPAAAEPAQAVTITRAPRELDTSVERGYAAFTAGDLDAARQSYSAALRNDPLNRDAQLGLAAIDVRTGNLEAADLRYQRLLEIDPRDANAQAGLMGLRSRLDPVQSESRLKTLIGQQPESPALHFALGNQYAAQARWTEAQQSYFRAHSADPENPDYAFNLAVSLDQMRQRRIAADYYERAINLAQNRPAAFDRIAATTRMQELKR